MRKFVFGLMMALSLAACTKLGSDAHGNAAARASIDKINAEFSKAIAAEDFDALVAFYSADGQILAPGLEPIRGAEGIRSFWITTVGLGVAAMEFKVVELLGEGSEVTEVGEYAALAEGGEVIERGKSIVIWRQERGEWKIFRDMFSSNTPTPTE